MSVWGDMGIVNGKMFGVWPGVFLSAAYGFFAAVRAKAYPSGLYNFPEQSFDFLRKAGTGLYVPTRRIALDRNYIFGSPVGAANWNGLPDWPSSFALTEADLIGEALVPNPFNIWRDVSEPAWALQRYKLIQALRYIVIPLKITVYGQSHEDYFVGIKWTDGEELTATMPDYWRQGVSRIGIEGESGKPVGTSWITSSSWSYTYHGEDVYQTLRIYGAADLSTHPDFSQYFDIA